MDSQSKAEEMLSSLSESELDVLRLFYYGGKSSKEIASELNVSEEEVTNLHTKAIHALRGNLQALRDEIADTTDDYDLFSAPKEDEDDDKRDILD